MATITTTEGYLMAAIWPHNNPKPPPAATTNTKRRASSQAKRQVTEAP